MSLKIVNWNVLADCYARGAWKPGIVPSTSTTELDPVAEDNSEIPIPPNQYTSSTSTPVSWSIRKELLAKTLFAVPTIDVYTLQEVDHYVDFYQPLFENHGYESLYVQRPRKHDGCLIAFRKDAYTLLASEMVDLDR